MYLSRTLDNSFIELFRKGLVKGTVILSHGGEATTVGMTMPFRPGTDILSLLHRDLGGHLVSGASVYSLTCQHMANSESPTMGREGNVHHGNAAQRRFPMISHLGNMLAPAVGGTWAARFHGEDAFGLGVIGDGGSSTGDFHESLNLASVRKVPVLFAIENNHYAYSTPTKLQYNCERLSERAAGYGIPGKTIDGTDAWEVYRSVCDALDTMAGNSLPYLLECMCLRLEGHAAYDKAEYIPPELRQQWLTREPLAKARRQLAAISGYSERQITDLEREVERHVSEEIAKAAKCARPDPLKQKLHVFAAPASTHSPSFQAKKVKNGNAVTLALDYILRNHSEAVLLGQDIGQYGSAFKTCKGLFETHGPNRVIDTPICESAMVGFCLGASQCGVRPVVEFQFADFATEAVTQLGLNAATWYFRSHSPAPLLLRLPCGGGITLGAFHSGEFEGLWSRFPGLKIVYPTTPQETFEALVAGFYDQNPCIVLEHKALYWSRGGDIAFDGDLEAVFQPRQYAEGTEITIVAIGAACELAVRTVSDMGCLADIWNPFVIAPADFSSLERSVEKTGRLLVVQESGAVAGIGNHILAAITSKVFHKLKSAPHLVSAPDMPVPFARELESFYLPDRDTLRNAIEKTIGGEG